MALAHRPLQVFIGMHGRGPCPSSSRSRGFDGPKFSGQLEDLREFRRSWGEYERLNSPRSRRKCLWSCCTVRD
jgi:hypothetical protein